MSKVQIFDGPEINLMDVLEARENRARHQLEVYKQYRPGSLLSVTLNIPGNVKTSERLKSIFNTLMLDIKQSLEDVEIKYSETFHLSTGSEAYIFTNLKSKDFKKRMVSLESHHSYGRIFDLDVMTLQEGVIQDVKRQEVGEKERECYICNRPAKECGRSRKHSVEEMKTIITNMIIEK